jgi:hypothetical protein
VLLGFILGLHTEAVLRKFGGENREIPVLSTFCGVNSVFVVN